MVDRNLAKSGLNFSGCQETRKETKLNLVALMDIFTILVFFLLLNNGEANNLENANFVKLPNSSASSSPHVEAMLIVKENEVWFNGESIAQFAKKDARKILDDAISSSLTSYSTEREVLNEYEKKNGLSVTILGDKSVSFSLLEEVMAICSKNNFRDISLAVNQVSAQPFLTRTGGMPSKGTTKLASMARKGEK